MCFQVLESHQLREENEVYHGQPVFVWPDSLMALLKFKGDKKSAILYGLRKQRARNSQ